MKQIFFHDAMVRLYASRKTIVSPSTLHVSLINEQQRYRYSDTIGTFSFLQSSTVNTFSFNNDECSDFNFQFILTSLQVDKNSSCPRLLVSFLFFTLSKMYRSIGQIAFRCHFVDFKFLHDVHYDAVMTWRHNFFFVSIGLRRLYR